MRLPTQMPLASAVSLCTVASSWRGGWPGPPWLAALSQACRGVALTQVPELAGVVPAAVLIQQGLQFLQGGGGGAGGEPFLQGLVVPLDLAAGLGGGTGWTG